MSRADLLLELGCEEIPAGYIPPASERLRQLGASVRPREVHALMGDPSRVIPRLAVSIGAGLVVMGTHGRRGIGRMVLGSVAEATLRRAPCPVLTLKTADFQPATARPAVRFPALP